MSNLICILIILLPLILSLWIGFKTLKGIQKPSDFFWYPGGMSYEKLRDSLAASNISVGSSIFAFLSFGYSYKIAAIISPISWLIGFWLLYKVFPCINNSSKKTLHGFLAERYQNSFIGYLASILSIIGFLGTFGIEILVGTKITNILFPSFSSVWVVILLSLVICGYTAIGGFKAVIDTERMQLIGSLVGICAVFGYSFWYAYSSNMDNLDFSILSSNHFGFSNLTLLFVVSLMVVNVPWQLIDMSVWQRVSSLKNQKDIKKGLSQSILFIGVSWLLLLALGMLLNYFPGFQPPANDDYASSFMVYIKNPYIFALFAAGCFAALISTADTLLIASVQTFIFDILYPKTSLEIFENNSKGKRLINYGRKWVFILGIVSPIVIYLISIIVPGILDLFFLVYSAQIILLFPVLFAIFSPKAIKLKSTAIASLCLGLFASFVMTICMLFYPNTETYLLAPIVSISVSALPWLFSLKKLKS